MGVSYRSPSAGFSLFYVLLFPALVACGEPAAVATEFFVRPHVVASCDPDVGSTVTLAALGPFPPSNQTVENLPLYGSTRELRFPADTSAVEAVATDGARRFLGYTERKREGGFELTLLPERRECVLFSPQEGFPRDSIAKALGFSPSTGVLFAAGGRNEVELAQGASDSGSASGAMRHVWTALAPRARQRDRVRRRSADCGWRSARRRRRTA
jgi:hypothetical protein